MRKVFITGGSGFIGKALARALLSRGVQVVVASRSVPQDVVALGAHHVVLDLAKPSAALGEALRGCDTVFHVAAHVGLWGPYQDFYQVNVVGTEQLLRVAAQAGVQQFVFTSSPSVVANGKNLRGVDERQPYPATFHAYYPQTKALAERRVHAAHDTQGMRTISIRPHLVFGPGDNHIIPMIVARAQAGVLSQIGSGENIVDFTFIDDCVQGHIKAAEALARDPSVGGQAYFITQGDPVSMWWWIRDVLRRSGTNTDLRRVPYQVAYAAAGMLEVAYRYLPLRGEPRFTRFLVSELATDHYFDISAARARLGYQPSCSTIEALQRTF